VSSEAIDERMSRAGMLLAPLRGARAAVVFLTRIPAGGFPYAPVEQRWASAWFPAVGLAVGAIAAGAFVAGRAAGPLVAAGLALAASVLATGAFHEDGLADSADALGGAMPGDREKLFAILKDSRVGVFGAVAVALSLLLRAAALARLDAAAPAALLLAHCAARTSPVWLMAALPYVTDAEWARSRPLAHAAAPQVALASLICLGAFAAGAGGVLASPRDVAVVGAVVVGVAVVAGWRFRARAGGITGDFLGAAEQVTECAVLVALAILRGGPGGSG
jgi:adenosylcobinamide-GDP ribazoletransferase